MKNIMLCFACICTILTSTFAQYKEVNFTLHYPTSIEDADNIVFKNTKATLEQGTEISYPSYELGRKTWQLGEVFQLVIHPIKGMEAGGYFYVIGLDSKGDLKTYFPNTFNKTKSLTTKAIHVPALHNGISIVSEGMEQLCVLHSNNMIADWEASIKALQTAESSNLAERVEKVFGKQLAKLNTVNYHTNKLGYRFKKLDKIIPLFVNIEVQAPSVIIRENEELTKPALHLLSIGPSFIDLEYTEKDAIDISSFFQSQEDKYRKVTINNITGEQATKAAILTALGDIKTNYKAGKIKEQDIVLLYISSHGFLTESDELFIHSSDFNRVEREQSSLNYNDIYQAIKDVKCNKLVLLDLSASHAFDVENVQAFTSSSFIKPLIDERINTILSNRMNEYSYENEAWGNGAFTEALLEGLGGKANINQDANIQLSELYEYILNRTPTLVNGALNKAQHPVMSRPFYYDFELLSH